MKIAFSNLYFAIIVVASIVHASSCCASYYSDHRERIVEFERLSKSYQQLEHHIGTTRALLQMLDGQVDEVLAEELTEDNLVYFKTLLKRRQVAAQELRSFERQRAEIPGRIKRKFPFGIQSLLDYYTDLKETTLYKYRLERRRRRLNRALVLKRALDGINGHLELLNKVLVDDDFYQTEMESYIF